MSKHSPHVNIDIYMQIMVVMSNVRATVFDIGLQI